MASQPSGLLILDANVLIDYCATHRGILKVADAHSVHEPG